MRSNSLYLSIVAGLGVAFAAAFGVIVVPALLRDGDVVGAFAAGFVNPYASGYSLDTIICGLILTVWALHERRPFGWLVVPLCLLPGVATAFAFYLVLRARTEGASEQN
ncbi:MAG: DUF2834 domain-containing protein [Pseudomonadota bacterium]